jgi:nitrite reductase/ring-hydroxylating ferredoxin subunit
MMIAGWMGGTLVHRNQIGVDIRYAGAGKWKEEYITVSAKKTQVATADELKVNQMKLIHVDKKRIAIAKTENGYVAFDDRCTHKGGTLAGGAMICSTVQCPWHGSQFDVRTGKVKAGPAKEKIIVYNISEEGGKIFLEI